MSNIETNEQKRTEAGWTLRMIKGSRFDVEGIEYST
jgi:hypothetical protein